MKFQTVLFDLGHTLIYFDADWDEIDTQAFQVLTQSLRASGFPVDEDKFPRLFAAALNDYYRQRDTEFIEHTRYYVLRNLLQTQGIQSVPEAQLRQILKDMYQVSQQHWQVEKDTHPTLEFLVRSGYKLGLISNAGDDEDVQNLVDMFNLRPYFGVILTSAALGWRKPHPRIFQEALTSLHSRPGEAVMVGDMLGADVIGAHNAGLRSIWITRRSDQRFANRAHEDTIRPDATILALSELPCALLQLESFLS